MPPTDAQLVHLYRGELSRAVAYRVRLDTTTNWAIGLSAAMGSFVVGHADIPHEVALFAVAVDLLLLWVEARRYRAYQLAHYRVRLLERGLVHGEIEGWWEPVRRSYLEPVPPVGLVAALGRRLRRNYLWLVCSVLATWLLKLRLHGEGDLVAAAASGPIPGPVVVAGVGLLSLVLLVAAWRAAVEPIDG